MCLIIQAYKIHKDLSFDYFFEFNFIIKKFMRRKSMARRFMRTFMATILVLVILTLVEVNANDLSEVTYSNMIKLIYSISFKLNVSS
jgi:hypothetical protein